MNIGLCTHPAPCITSKPAFYFNHVWPLSRETLGQRDLVIWTSPNMDISLEGQKSGAKIHWQSLSPGSSAKGNPCSTKLRITVKFEPEAALQREVMAEPLFFSPKLPCGPCDLVSHRE